MHGDDDPGVGQPLCPDCYDYASQVVWQWWAPELWRRFTIALRRLLAHHLGTTPARLGEVASLQYAKVAEYQLRGAVHSMPWSASTARRLPKDSPRHRPR